MVLIEDPFRSKKKRQHDTTKVTTPKIDKEIKVEKNHLQNFALSRAVGRDSRPKRVKFGWA